MSRMVGGTFGVAAIGALFQTLSTDRLARSSPGLGLTPGSTSASLEAMGSGQAGDASAASLAPTHGRSRWPTRCATPSCTRCRAR